MKRLISLLCFSFIFLNGFTQQKMSKERFENLSKAQQNLYLKVKSSDSLTTQRINDYLSIKGSDKNVIKEGRSIYVLTNVVNGKPLYTTTDNLNSARATGTNHLQPGGSLGLNLDGEGRTVAVWDGGPIQTTHAEFQNSTNTASRITNFESENTDGTNNLDDHGTHVTGTISARGVNPTAKGMAPNVSVRTWNFENDEIEIVDVLTNSNTPIYISNHSYGLPIDQPDGSQLDPWRMGAYTFDAKTVDDIMRENPKYLMVFSAGNSGTTIYPGGGLLGGFDKLTGNKNAKNNLVVANADTTINPFTSALTFDINPSSSQGPTDDLRIKPDIAGDGTAVTSPVSGDGYGIFNGTSMAAPNVTGSLVLLQQYYAQLHGEEINAATLRGLVCHTAVDDANTVGPDPNFGWGLLDAKRAAEVIAEDNDGLSVIDELTLNNNSTYVRNFTIGATPIGEKLSATICWTDISGASATQADENDTSIKRLVNDLDLRLIKDGVTYFPWRLEYSGTSFFNSKGDNIADNIERIDIDNPPAGEYTLVVSHKGALEGTGSSALIQDFSLVITGNNLTLSTSDNSLSGFSIFPNPSKGEFTFSFNSGSSNSDRINLEVHDISGRKVYNNIFNVKSSVFKETIDLTNMQPGVYIANISQGNSFTTRKLVIE